MLADDQVIESRQFDGLKLRVVLLELLCSIVFFCIIIRTITKVEIAIDLLVQISCLFEVVLNQLWISLEKLSGRGL